MDELILAYTAGLIDGEGYIGLIPSSISETSLVPKVKVASISPEIVNFLKDTYGGHLDKARKHKGNCRDSYMWSLSNKVNVLDFLSKIRKYLKLKNKQADLVCKYCDSCSYAEMRNSQTRTSAIKKRMYFYDALKALNHRGRTTAAETK